MYWVCEAWSLSQTQERYVKIVNIQQEFTIQIARGLDKVVIPYSNGSLSFFGTHHRYRQYAL